MSRPLAHSREHDEFLTSSSSRLPTVTQSIDQEAEQMMLTRITRLVVTLALIAGAAACGTPEETDTGVASARGAPTAGTAGTAGTPTTDTESEQGDGLRAWAACMREAGADVPDPDPDGKLTGWEPPDKGSPEAQLYEQAEQTCGLIDSVSGEPPEPLTTSEVEQWRDWAQCMRDNGVDIEDPDPTRAVPPEPNRDPTLSRETIDAADDACMEWMPGGDRDPAKRLIPDGKPS
jgi:hypothetical protein